MPQPPRQRNPLARILVMLVGLAGLLLVAVILVNLFSSPQPRVENYVPPPPEMNPPALPAPETYTEATSWLQRNAVYTQSIQSPTDCDNLKPIDANGASSQVLNEHLLQVTACLMEVWQPPVSAANFVLPRPPATVYNQPIETKCGKLPAVNAVYCGADQRIYYSTRLPEAFPPSLRDSRFLMEMVLGHEFGHAIQARTGISISSSAWEQRASTEAEANKYSRRLELQADCLSGMWVKAVAPSQGLTDAERQRLSDLAFNLGDDILKGEPGYDGGHGSGESRKRWFLLGLQNTSNEIGQCNTYTAPDGQVR